MPEIVNVPERERRIFARQHVNLSNEPVAIGVPRTAAAASPSLRVVRDQDQITKIEVTCTCGCTMRILCDYELPTA